MADGNSTSPVDWLGRPVNEYFHYEEMPASFSTAATIHIVVCSIGLSLDLVVMRLLVAAYKDPSSESARPIIKLLLCLTIFGSLSYITNGLQGLAISACFGWTPLIAPFFILSNMCCFLILGKRAKYALGASDRKMRKAADIMEFNALGMIPFSVACYFLMNDSKFFNKYCVMKSSTALSTIFLVANTLMCSGYLALFFYPIWKHLQRMHKTAPDSERSNITASNNQKDTAAKSLQKIVKRNFCLGLLTISSTFINMLLITVLEWRGDHTRDKELAFLAISQYTLAMVDLTINTIALLWMNKAWIPRSWKNLRKFTHTKQTSENYKVSQTPSAVKRQPTLVKSSAA